VHIFLVVAVVSLPFTDLEVFRIAGKSIVLPYLTAFLLLIPLLPRLRSAFVHLQQDVALPWLLAWFLAACLSTASIFFWYQRAEIFDRNATQLLNLLMMIVQYALFLCAIRATRPERVPWIATTLVWAAAAAGAYSLYQVAAVYLGLPAPDVLRTSNLYHRLNTLSPTGAGGWAGMPRAFGVAPEPSFWGAYLVFTAAFVLGRLRTKAGLGDLGALLLVSAAILVTFSRGAWLTFMAVVALWGLSRMTPRLAPAVLGLILVFLGASMWPLMAGDQSFSGLADLSAVGRLASQQTAWRIFFDHPVFGIGLGSAEFFVQRYNIVFPSVSTFGLEHIYNFYLLVLVSTGLLGFALFLGFLLTLVRRLDIAFRTEAGGGELRQLRVAVALAYASCLGLWLNTPAYNFTFVWFTLALVSALPAMLQEAAPKATELPARHACASPSI
jgi:O-antigen ligase